VSTTREVGTFQELMDLLNEGIPRVISWFEHPEKQTKYVQFEVKGKIYNAPATLVERM